MLFFSQNNLLYSQKSDVKQDPKFEQLLKEKRKVNSGIVTNTRYKIQIFNGNNELSKKALIDFKNEFKDYDATIIFSTPNYKVWVGNYKTRIEAEKNLKIIIKKYPNALIIKPSK
ncbi:MAG: SPOR domain-containing protein [Flavobacterium sp.]|nr:SPOR domain-containing protein [Flavobacterium sp.]